MSLLNNVLRDLQTRGELGVEPLTGLEPVAEAPTQHRWHALLLPALAALSVASAIALWGPVTDGRWIPSFARIMVDGDTRPQSKLQTVPKASPQAEPDLAAASDNATAGNNAAIGENAATADDAAISDISRGVTPINTTSDLKSPPVDDYVADTQADSPPSSQVSVESAVSPATATTLRRKTGNAAIAAARSAARGVAAMRGDDLLNAERLFREALTIDPGNGAVWSYLYSTLVKASKPAAAEQALRRGLISAKEPAPLAKLYARLLLDRDEKDAAVGILRTHRPVAASDTEYDAFLAALLQQLGQYAEAGEIYRKLLTVEPDSGSWWIGLAMSSDSIGNRPDALSSFQRALRTDSLKTPLARYARQRTAELQAYD
jgi:tetratricopeptide (TPR) repeat protein